jgi:hypothetical protein
MQYRYFVGLVFLLVPCMALAQVRGRVVATDGTSVTSVEIWSDAGPVTIDRSGSFTVSLVGGSSRKTVHVVRASAPGYRPQTMVVRNGVDAVFSLRRDAAAVWAAPKCAIGASMRGRAARNIISGFRIRLSLPPGTEVQKESDLENARTRVCLGNTCLSHTRWGIAGNALDSLVAPEVFAGVAQMQERDLYDPDLHRAVSGGVEYKGTRSDGTVLRWVGLFGESIVYDHATQSAAKLFDTIIDSMCWLDRK